MSKKINVCHLCNLGMNGKAVFLCNLLEHTDFSKYDITILNYRAEKADAVISRLEKLPVKIINPDSSSTKSYINLLKKHFKNNRIDVVHSHIWDLSGLFLREAKKAKIPVRVAHSHNTSKASGRYNKVKEIIRDKLIWNILRYMIQINANRFVACSHEAAEWLFTKKIVKKQKYTVAINGIDFNAFSSSGKIATPQKTEILFAGRLVYQKNPLFALEIFSHYFKLNPNSHLTIIGDGKLKGQVEQKISDLSLLDNVTIISQTNNMADYYLNADAFLLPTRYEGLGIVLIEAQSCNTKCLTSNNVPLTTQCGLVRYLPLELGAEGWSKELNSLINNTDLKINKKSLSIYDIDNTVKQIDKIYEISE